MKTARTLTVLSIIGAAAGLLGGTLLIHHLAKTTQDQEKS